MISFKDLNEGMTDSVQLVCPICHSELILEKPYRYRGRVQKGEIHCSKGCAVFPIISGVPIILPTVKPSISDDQIKRVKGWMRKDWWDKSVDKGYIVLATKGDRTSSSESNVIAIAERLRKIESGVVIDIGCGGGFTTERVLQSIQPSVYSVSLDIDFGCAKKANKRAELLGMSNRSMAICADARQLPFADGSFSAIYTRNGFNHIRQYANALKEAYRILKNNCYMVVAENKQSTWHISWSDEFARIGLDYDGQILVIRHLGCFIDKLSFIEDLKQARFDVLSVDEIDDTPYFLVEAKK